MPSGMALAATTSVRASFAKASATTTSTGSSILTPLVSAFASISRAASTQSSSFSDVPTL